jgi:hypothetical protein
MALDTVVATDRELAVSLLWGFWQTLAEKVRAANAQMSELFGAPSEPFRLERSEDEAGDRVHVTEETKLDILREQGLSAQELRLLAKYSRERLYSPNALIFAEGEPGDCLYIVVDGAVRISRMVPGMGEECLAILERGEVGGAVDGPGRRGPVPQSPLPPPLPAAASDERAPRRLEGDGIA